MTPPHYPDWRHASSESSSSYRVESWQTIAGHRWYRIILQRSPEVVLVILHESGNGDPTIALEQFAEAGMAIDYVEWLKTHLDEALMEECL